MGFFPFTLEGDTHERRVNTGILFRVDINAVVPSVIVQSNIAPDSIFDNVDNVRVINSGLLIDAATNATYCRIRVDLNAVKRMNSKVTSRVPNTELASWITERFRNAITVEDIDSAIQGNVKGKNGVPIFTVSITADIKVNDPESFRAFLTSGVGRSKAYGCGLVTATQTG
jgi:CRISPR system Cascade subunit CasE